MLGLSKGKSLKWLNHEIEYNEMCPFTVREQLTSIQGWHRLEKYLKIKSDLKSTGKLFKNLEKSLNSTIFCRT